MSNDVVYKQAGKKPTTYPDPYLTGIPVVEVDDKNTEPISIRRFGYGLNLKRKTPKPNETSGLNI